MTKRREWLEFAECAKHDPVLWDIDRPAHWHEAIEICRTCPVRVQCLEYGQVYEESGVYAGIPLMEGKHRSEGYFRGPQRRPHHARDP